MPLIYLLGLPATVICMVTTAIMAFRFGWQFGSEPLEQWSFALGLVAVDVIKGFLLIAAAVAWEARRFAQVATAVLAFFVFTALSLLSTFGMGAIQSASKIGAHTAVATSYRDSKAEVDRLLAERAKIEPKPVADGFACYRQRSRGGLEGVTASRVLEAWAALPRA